MNNLEKLNYLVEKAGYKKEIPAIVNDLETALKALEIIKNKKVDCHYLHYLSVIGGSVNDYNAKLTTNDLNCLTQEEFDIVNKELEK